ncbi:hypothetical protein [Acidimangrovimonas sediminis]|uniref:hypothetical protein n=1 Tax=Acidimangrovimonas sediminis TaxID=2056283 RepID=UPI000C80DF3C|nr:hypothetical protein [Acidimangrovimonas sediminis]
MGRSKTDRIFLFAVLCFASFLLYEGRLQLVALMLMMPLFYRVVIIVADVFWTSFTGQPLVRARPEGGREAGKDDGGDPSGIGPFSRLSNLPAPLRSAAPRRVDLFSDQRGDIRLPPQSARLRALKKRLGYL